MRLLVTGSSGHLGEALVRTLRGRADEVVGLDALPSAFTTHVGSIGERDVLRRALTGVQTVFHAATLHKPHLAGRSRREFVDVNVTGTLNLLEQALRAGVESLIYTSTTSVFGDALVPPAGTPAAWVTEELTPIPKNVYGVTKAAAEDLCQEFCRNNRQLACVVLRTSRFFPEEDDDDAVRAAYSDQNVKVNELLYRRVDLEDVVSAHLLAARLARDIGFRRYVISATTPFVPEDLAELRSDAPKALRRRVPEFEAEYDRRGWRMFPSVDRVYVNQRARRELGWQPRHDFRLALARLRTGEDIASPLARQVGSKGYKSA
jgi:nucleoside-diphosphate-sugar epimerase